MLRLELGRRTFAPSLAATLPMLLLLALLLWLGTWQLDRAGQSRAQLEAYARGDAAAVPLPPAPRTLPRYSRVRLVGRYLAERQFLLDNMTHAGAVGYRVLTPLVTERGETVLVDRGWLPAGPSRATLPAIAVGDEPREVVGRVDALPRPGIELGAASASGPWPRVVGFPKLAELAGALGRPLYPDVVLLDAGAPDGFLRDWHPGGLPPERHVGYAVQWFALALTLLAGYVVASLRRKDVR